MYSIRTELVKVATERDWTEKYSVSVPKKIDSVRWGGNLLPGLMLQCLDSYPAFIDKKLCIHYSHNHMIHLLYILETFEPVQRPSSPPTPLISNTTIKVGSQLEFLRYRHVKGMLLVFSTLCGFFRPFCAYKSSSSSSYPF